MLSEPGRGTEVRVHLPLVLPAEPVAAALPARPGAVLLVDDDAISLMLMAEMLRRGGLTVLEAAHADAALQLWRQHSVALVVSDRYMPGLDGPALLLRIGQEAAASGRPCPARVLCSGDALHDVGLPGHIDAALSKPVAAGVLLQLLASLGVRPVEAARPGPVAWEPG